MKKISDNNTLSKILQEDEISNIHFYKIDFSWKDLSFKVFNDCTFESCNLSNVKFKNTSLNNIEFCKSKILWVNFVEINTFYQDLIFMIVKFLYVILCDLN